MEWTKVETYRGCPAADLPQTAANRTKGLIVSTMNVNGIKSRPEKRAAVSMMFTGNAATYATHVLALQEVMTHGTDGRSRDDAFTAAAPPARPAHVEVGIQDGVSSL